VDEPIDECRRHHRRSPRALLVTARYMPVAHVLPGLHVSALTTPALIAELGSGALSGPPRSWVS